MRRSIWEADEEARFLWSPFAQSLRHWVQQHTPTARIFRKLAIAYRTAV